MAPGGVQDMIGEGDVEASCEDAVEGRRREEWQWEWQCDY